MTFRPEFTLHDLLLASAGRAPDAIAIVDGDLELTYGELAHRSRALSRALRESGVRRGDRVGIYMEKTWESVVATMAISLAGAVFVHLNPQLKARQAPMPLL